MRQTLSKPRHETEPGERPQPSREAGLTVSLWLLAVLMAEAELLLWVLERAYGS